jgi:Neuraminidase (sialidase)
MGFCLWHCADSGPEVIQENGVTKIRLLPPKPGNPRNSEGDFIQLNDGRILFVYSHFTGGGGDHDAAHLAGRYSSDGGRTWTKEDVIVLPNEGGMNVMSVSLLRLQKGEIALFYARKNALDDNRVYMRTSRDEAQSWSEGKLCIEPGGYYVLNNDRVIQLKSGRLVMPVARHNVPGGEWTSRGVALCFLSDDKGQTWRASADELQGPPESKTGLQEPGVLELKDGRLMMLCRTDQGSQFRSYSHDGGNHWSAAEATDLKSPVSPATVERIPKTNDLLLVWNDHSNIDESLKAKRTPFNVAISRDEGQTWVNVKTLENDPEGWYCYTALEFVNGRVLLGHCAGGKGIGRLNRTQITYFDVDWLYQ